MGEQTETDALVRDLNRALPLLARDAVAAALAAAVLPGPVGIALAEPLRAVAAGDLTDLGALAGRVATLGGTPTNQVERLELPDGWRPAVERLLEMQREALDALVDAIPADADDAEGEATEHLLEHVIARKRDAIELLERAVRD